MATFTACRKDDLVDLQKIDQVIEIYVRGTAGQDLLNPNLKNSYNVIAYDLGGEFDKTKIATLSPKADKDTIRYIEYISGATRYLKDSISPASKTYQSLVALEFTKKINDSVSQSVLDTMQVNYLWTPQVFQVSNIYWNSKKVFDKVDGQPNQIIVIK